MASKASLKLCFSLIESCKLAFSSLIFYDATGKPTQNNELDFIGRELSKFISQLEH
jgi:hypothetical protein